MYFSYLVTEPIIKTIIGLQVIDYYGYTSN